jgi:hypothetical protein
VASSSACDPSRSTVPWVALPADALRVLGI